jgi:hypothetical protein
VPGLVCQAREALAVGAVGTWPCRRVGLQAPGAEVEEGGGEDVVDGCVEVGVLVGRCTAIGDAGM